ncbi:MAG TPA: DUF6786 family protein [Puia sp.]|nr:DUF6786 family protein [Puia sp.]
MQRLPGLWLLLSTLATLSACNDRRVAADAPGTFGYDLAFLQKHDSVIVLHSGDAASIIVSPKYQGKVFTSTAAGDTGASFGWIHYKAFDGPADPHMNAYGGEDRLWLGPEGGRFSLFFPPGAKMEFANWKTPAAFDTEPWDVTAHNDSSVTLRKDMQLTNYAGTRLNLSIDRQITVLNRAAIDDALSLSANTRVQAVGYRTINTLTNTGGQAWTETTGMPCIWMLDMFPPSPSTVIVVPYQQGDGSKPTTTDYFGEIPAARIKIDSGILYFRADGKMRGKLGIHPGRATPVAGSYDPQHHVLTIIQFDTDTSARYLNQEWNTTKPPFSGDAVNAYNDGPLADGSQMGPFYELESVSPAAFLGPGGHQTHRHSVFHFTGPEADLSTISARVLGVPVGKLLSSMGL